MRKRVAVAAGTVGVVASVVAGGIAVASNDGEGSITGPQADRATAAALKATDGGTANSVEQDSENGATWEVEVTRTDGKTVDVRLDEHYRVVVIEQDREG
jgi:uncharacterized membrane protein YkoI